MKWIDSTMSTIEQIGWAIMYFFILMSVLTLGAIGVGIASHIAKTTLQYLIGD